MEYIARPQDRRCRYWAKVAYATTALPSPAVVEGADQLPGAYLRAGSDVELEPGDVVFEGEANHATKQRGWTFNIGVCVVDASGAETIRWLRDDEIRRAKDFWRAAGRADMTRGSGPHAAMVRAAAWLREGSPTVREALAALEGAPPAPTTDAPTP